MLSSTYVTNFDVDFLPFFHTRKCVDHLLLTKAFDFDLSEASNIDWKISIVDIWWILSNAITTDWVRKKNETCGHHLLDTWQKRRTWIITKFFNIFINFHGQWWAYLMLPAILDFPRFLLNLQQVLECFNVEKSCNYVVRSFGFRREWKIKLLKLWNSHFLSLA